MHLICTFSFLIFYLITFVYADSVELCSTLENIPGNCVEIKYCPPLMQILMKKPVSTRDLDYLKNSNCGFKGIHPKVCCALDDCLEENFANPVVPEENAAHIDILPDLQDCGLLIEDRMIGGIEAQLSTYPWVALLQYSADDGLEFHCGGVLINNRYVLTAAHCIQNETTQNLTLKSVRLGDHNITSINDCDNFYEQFDCCCADPYLDIEVEEVLVHNKYNPGNAQHDIALIRLAKNVTYTDFVQPVCLEKTSTSSNTLISGALASVVGWGADENGYKTDTKSRNIMDIIDMSVCENEYLPLRVNFVEQICAAPRQSASTDVNQYYGDSGGVLHGWNVNAKQFAVGIMSVANFDKENYSIIFTNVKQHTPWIIANLKP